MFFQCSHYFSTIHHGCDDRKKDHPYYTGQQIDIRILLKTDFLFNLCNKFEHNVRKQPNAVALSAGEHTMTYA
ncbi:hypothetical protein ACQ4LK_07265, partial [Bacillus pumilus]